MGLGVSVSKQTAALLAQAGGAAPGGAARAPAFVGEMIAINISASINETHSMTATVSKHPIEDGSKIADHVQSEPTTVSMEGVIVADDDGGGAAEVTQRKQDLYARLEELFATKELVSLLTGLKTYERMLFTKLVTTRDRTTGNIVRFTADLEQVTFATAETVALKADVKSKGSKKTDLGPKGKTAAPAAAAAESRKSTLSRLTNGKQGARHTFDAFNSLGAP